MGLQDEPGRSQTSSDCVEVYVELQGLPGRSLPKARWVKQLYRLPRREDWTQDPGHCAPFPSDLDVPWFPWQRGGVKAGVQSGGWTGCALLLARRLCPNCRRGWGVHEADHYATAVYRSRARCAHLAADLWSARADDQSARWTASASGIVESANEIVDGFPQHADHELAMRSARPHAISVGAPQGAQGPPR